jgi:DNA repair protein SbcD/Mre11
VAIVIHAADLHIDCVGAVRASRQAVVRLVDLVLGTRADLLVIAGDAFDRTADTAAAGRFLATELDRLGQVGTPVLVAAGNHDAVCPRATAGTGTVRWFPTDAPATVVLDGIGVAVHGQGLADPVEPRDLTAAFPPPLPGYVNVGVLHTSLDGAMSRTICAPASAAGLGSAGYDYWALGHVHRRRVVAADPWIVYPGSGSASVVTTVAGAVATVEHRELRTLVPA